MSERYEHSEAGAEGQEAIVEAAERSKELLNEAKREASRAESEDAAAKLRESRKAIDEAAESAKDAEQHSTVEEEPQAATTFWYTKEYARQAYSQMMGRTRRQLKRPDRVVSRVIHQPVIEQLSELGEKTIARPSGVLVGSICAFVASLVTYMLARRYGYDMSYAVFLYSLLGGFLLGIVGEFALRAGKALLARS